MPRMEFSPENVKVDPADYPQLKLEYQETARIVVLGDLGAEPGRLEQRPMMQFIHQLRAPDIINGKAHMDTVQNDDGTTREVIAQKFVGKHVCLGRFEVVADKGMDPEHCPTCKASAEGANVKPPERRFATHVFRYGLKPGSLDVAEPFQGQILAWLFGEERFATLTGYRAQWSKGPEDAPLLRHDLFLGPCKNKHYQKYEMQIAPQAAWMASDDRKRLVLSSLKENRCDDLELLIARRRSITQIEEDLDTVAKRWAQARGEGITAEDLDQAAAQMDVEAILGETPPAAPAAVAAVPDQSAEALLAALGSEEEPEAEAAEANGSSGEVDFADILKDLG